MLPNFDYWLEQPYIDRDREQAAFESWCDAFDTEPEEIGAWEAYEEYLADDEPDPDRYRDDPLNERDVW